jgi:hypothetical protein
VEPCTSRQHFQCDFTIQPLVMRTVENAHASCADLPHDAVVTERLTDELGRGRYSRILGRFKVQGQLEARAEVSRSTGQTALGGAYSIPSCSHPLNALTG